MYIQTSLPTSTTVVGVPASALTPSTSSTSTATYLSHNPYSPSERAGMLMQVAEALLAQLIKGQKLDAVFARSCMTDAFLGTDASGTWDWRDAYEAQELACVLFVRQYHAAIKRRNSFERLGVFDKLHSLLLTQTRRSDQSQRWQQFSTPLTLGVAGLEAAMIAPDDTVLEPSAGTGLLASLAGVLAEQVVVNELEPRRLALLKRLFAGDNVLPHNAEHIDDLMPRSIKPTVILMNPPFSHSPTMSGSNPAITGRHVASALARLESGGRLVAITGRSFAPEGSKWRAAFERLQQTSRVVYSVPLAGKFFAPHGTSIETRLTVMDKTPAVDPSDHTAWQPQTVQTPKELLELIRQCVPPRQTIVPRNESRPAFALVAEQAPKSNAAIVKQAKTNTFSVVKAASVVGELLSYTPKDWSAPTDGLQDCLYETYTPQSIHIPLAKPHPTPLVQSAAMASVAPPKPAYRPTLPAHLIEDGVLSDAQLESIVYAGQAHDCILPGAVAINQHFDMAHEAEQDADDTVTEVTFRQGWFLGDGTGCGKGRQVAGIILDNRLKGRKRALWVSKNDKLLEDARRDWAALGGDPAQVVPLSKYKQGQEIDLKDGILFLTYGTLRSGARQGKISRVQQIVNWLGQDFDGPVMFDESHALANATAAKGDRGVKAASKQGEAGLRLQRALPNARVCYVSATGATDVSNLAYAERLGLWGQGTAFATRSAFVSAMDAGGVAAMEVISRDLKAMGLYTARSLSYDGVEVDILEHELTPEQIDIYDSYAEAYQVIHAHLHSTLEALNITAGGSTLNRNAKSAAISAFESSKQRFFNHMLTAMKCPSLLRAIEADTERGDAVIIQLVSTGEAMLERRLAHVPSSEWQDLSVDITPREYVLDYLAHAFPTQVFEVYTDEEGEPRSRPMMDADGNPVMNRTAEQTRDQMIEKLASLPAVPTALDQVLHHFGTDRVAEVTGRSIRMVRTDGIVKVDKRSSAANLDETRAFMDDEKQILVFSDAGGTGRSYHADLSAKNHRRRVHYLLEPGWRADNAIQGLGRSNRTNQACAPLFRPVATNVKGEKRFLSTIARRLDTLGAITKGQRQTGGQGMFRAEDNLESTYARAALRQLYHRIVRGQVPACSLETFEHQTGLSLLDSDGSVREDLPPMSRFLNRVLAMPISSQNALFDAFEQVLEQILEGLKASGGLDVGVETLQADGFRILEDRDVFCHERTGAITRCLKIEQKDRLTPKRFEELVDNATQATRFMMNTQSGRVAASVPAPSRMSESGAVDECVRLVRPLDQQTMTVTELAASKWQDVPLYQFREAWEAEVATVPTHRTSTFHVVTGLLLPIWDRMSKGSMRIYRLQTDDGQRVLGRVVMDKDLPAFYNALGLDAPNLTPETIWSSIMQDGTTYPLVQNMSVRRSRIMGLERVELVHDQSPAFFDELKAMGCMTEIIQYRRRVFIPSDSVLAAIVEKFPLQTTGA